LPRLQAALKRREVFPDLSEPGPIRRNQAPNERASLLDLLRGKSMRGMCEKTQNEIAFATSAPTPICKRALALMGRSLSRTTPASKRTDMSEQQMAAFVAAWTNEGTMGATPRGQGSKFDPSRDRGPEARRQDEHIYVSHGEQRWPVSRSKVGGTQFPEARGHDLSPQDGPPIGCDGR
jgi:hypothetical protein